MAGSRTRATDDDLELDRDFLQQLHDLKLKLIDKAWVERRQKAVMKGQPGITTLRAHHTLCTRYFTPSPAPPLPLPHAELKRRLPPTKCRAVDGHFKVLSRAFVDHGASLIHGKDLRDFFVDLLENIVDVLQKELLLERDEVTTS